MNSTHHSQPPPQDPDSSVAKAWAVVRSRWRQEPLHPPTSMNLSQSPMAKFFEGPGAPPPRQGYRAGKSDGILIAWTLLCGLIPLLAFLSDPSGSTLVTAWVVGFLIWVVPAFWLTIIYLIARAGRRRCPVCGTHVKTGYTQCAGCGHNFAAAASR